MKKIITLTSFLILLSISPTSAMAAEVEQSQNQELETEVVCETGSYGEQTCRAKARGEQEQSQYVRVLGVHQMADTALDSKGQIAAFGIMAIGGLMAINKFKKII